LLFLIKLKEFSISEGYVVTVIAVN